MRLSDRQIERYSRQILLHEVGGTGQKALLAARVLAIGSGAALEAAVTYLAGSGIGTLDLLRDLASPTPPALPFAPLHARNVEIELGAPDRASVDVGTYDLVVVLRDDLVSPPETAVPSGRPRLGGVALHAGTGGRLALAIVPATAGCIACRVLDAEHGHAKHDEPSADVVDRASAGALAALVVCRWLLGLDPAPAAHALLLDPAGVAWAEEPLATRTPCPRGCPPVAQPV